MALRRAKPQHYAWHSTLPTYISQNLSGFAFSAADISQDTSTRNLSWSFDEDEDFPKQTSVRVFIGPDTSPASATAVVKVKFHTPWEDETVAPIHVGRLVALTQLY